MKSEELHTLRILEEIEKESALSQRALSARLGVSLGLANAFMKRLARKGYFKITTLPANRVKYILTPKGFAEKSRLTLNYLNYSLNFYREVKRALEERFRQLEAAGVRRLVLYGEAEIAELAGLLLGGSKLSLVATIIVESGQGVAGRGQALQKLAGLKFDAVLITAFEAVEERRRELVRAGVAPEKIFRVKG